MKLEFEVNDNTNFYYWLQAISGWDTETGGQNQYEYFRSEAGSLTSSQEAALHEIKVILSSSTNPRMMLCELYKGEAKSREAMEITRLAHVFREKFETINATHHKHLEEWLRTLNAYDFTSIATKMPNIVSFLNSTFSLNTTVKVYLVQNSPVSNATGHMIRGADFIILHPPGSLQSQAVNNVVSTLVHEYCHAIEFSSRTDRALLERAFKEIIETSPHVRSQMSDWKMAFVEAIVYALSSKKIGGYFRPEIYDLPIPTVDEMRPGFLRLVEAKKTSQDDVVNWIALNILPDIVIYMEDGRVMDQAIADKIADEYFNVYNEESMLLQKYR